MIAVSIICLAIIWPFTREQKQWLRAASFLPLGAAYLFAVCSFQRFNVPSLVGEWASTFSPSRWLRPIQMTYLDSQYKQAWEQQLGGYRYEYQIPKVKGETDYYSARLVELLAYDIPYRPRPIPQSYSAYTPKLAELNAAHLRSDNAPEFILFDNFALDKRYPSLEDGLSWPELLTRYDVKEVDLPYVLLSRSTTPRNYTLTPISDTTVKFGESFSMPTASNRPIWAQIEINRTLAGSAIAATFKPPMLFLKTKLRNGQQHTEEFLPGVGRSGFVLSPRIAESVWFASLNCNPWPRGMTANEVTSFVINSDTNQLPVDCYRDSVRIRLFSLDLPTKKLEDVPGLARLADLKDVRQRNSDKQGKLVHWPEEGSILCVNPNSQIQLGSPGNHSHLELGFGFSVPKKDKNMPGMTFRASALNDKSEATALWSKHVDPANDEPNCKQTVSLDLGTNEISNVLIETIPDGTNSMAKISPYWYQIHFE
jgi:hypothetical protein